MKPRCRKGDTNHGARLTARGGGGGRAWGGTVVRRGVRRLVTVRRISCRLRVSFPPGPRLHATVGGDLPPCLWTQRPLPPPGEEPGVPAVLRHQRVARRVDVTQVVSAEKELRTVSYQNRKFL